MRRTSKTISRTHLLLGMALVMVLSASEASAQTAVFHSPNDNGQNPLLIHNLPIGPGESLFLYLDAGAIASQNGVPCNDGDGREVCGYDIQVEALGTTFFVDFVPEANVVYNLTPTKVKINGLFSLNPALGAIRIGELKAGSHNDGAVMMTTGKVVLAGLQVESVPQQMVASVPEPIGTLPLMTGIAFLIGLDGRRRSRSRI
jgi:hypothetical protein